MIDSIKPNRMISARSMIRNIVEFPFKFTVEPKRDEWILFGFEQNAYYGKQKFQIEVEVESDIYIDVGYKKNVNMINIHDKSDLLNNVQIIDSRMVNNNKRIEIEWNKTNMFNEYYLFIKVFNIGDNMNLVSLNNIEWQNLS